MEPNRYYRDVAVWDDNGWVVEMIEVGAFYRWPKNPVHPLFSGVITAPMRETLTERVNAAIDWLLDGPCGYASRVADEDEKRLREHVVTDEDDQL